MSTVLEDLKAALPCRSSQLDLLYGFFHSPTEPFPASIFLNGGPSSGKTAVITSLLANLPHRHAIINLIECYTPKILFTSLLHQLNPTPHPKCDTMMDFVLHLQLHPSPAILVIDKCELFMHMDANLFPAFLKLAELTQTQISVVFISELLLQSFYPKIGLLEPITVAFPQYTKAELLEILAMGHLDNYKDYLNAFLSVFYRNCRDLAELKYLAKANFGAYLAASEQVAAGDQMGLWRRLAPSLKQALQGLYLRVEEHDGRHSLELPFYAKYLLIAAYLASYNDARDDKRFFMRRSDKTKKSDGRAKRKVSEKLNTQLGPKPFSFDRLLAIFYSILDDTVGFNNNLLVQVSSLVELQLLASLSDQGTLDAPKYKCNVDFEFIQGVAGMVGFNIRKYLSDFV